MSCQTTCDELVFAITGTVLFAMVITIFTIACALNRKGLFSLKKKA